MWSCRITLLSYLTVQSYARQVNILTSWKTHRSACSVLIPEDFVGSSMIGSLKVCNLAYLMRVVVSVSPKNRNNKKDRLRFGKYSNSQV